MTTLLRNRLSWLFFCLLAASAAYGQNVAPELNITLGEQRVRFAPTRSFQEMRLEVINSVGEIVFAHTTTEAEFDWNLRAANSEALAPGLYRYALTLKFGEDQSRQHTGHFIVEKGQDQIWLTASDGAEVSGTALNAARTSGRSLAGFRTSDDKSVKRDVSGREVVDEKGNKLTDVSKAAKQEKASLLGTQNKIAKFGVGGAADTDSTITEDATGKLGFGVAPSATTPLLFNGDINPALGGGLPAFTLQSNLDHARLEMRQAGAGAPIVQGRSAGGTLAAPTASPLNQILGGFGGSGYDATTGFAVISHGFIGIRAGELWAPTAHGTYMDFNTTANGSITRTEKMRITGAGNVGIGTTSPTAKLSVSGAESGQDGFGSAIKLSNTAAGGANWYLRAGATGTNTPVGGFSIANDSFYTLSIGPSGNVGIGNTNPLQKLSVRGSETTPDGFGATINLSNTAAGGANWYLRVGATDTSTQAAGFSIANDSFYSFVIDSAGNLGLGTGTSPLTDRVHVGGDLRVGTSGTSGCIRRFDGTGIIGFCSSDQRFKRDITPFPALLDKVAKLRPVNYYWRAAEFPQKQFGTTQAYGLIAQEVEAVLPELVSEDEQGYKQVDYSKLPLLTIQAVKELKAENESLKQQNEAAIKSLKAENATLQQRNTELDARLTALEQTLQQLLGQQQGQAQRLKR